MLEKAGELHGFVNVCSQDGKIMFFDKTINNVFIIEISVMRQASYGKKKLIIFIFIFIIIHFILSYFILFFLLRAFLLVSGTYGTLNFFS